MPITGATPHHLLCQRRGLRSRVVCARQTRTLFGDLSPTALLWKPRPFGSSPRLVHRISNHIQTLSIVWEVRPSPLSMAAVGRVVQILQVRITVQRGLLVLVEERLQTTISFGLKASILSNKACPNRFMTCRPSTTIRSLQWRGTVGTRSTMEHPSGPLCTGPLLKAALISARGC